MMTRTLVISLVALLLAGPAGAATMGDDSNAPWGLVIALERDDSNAPIMGDDSNAPFKDDDSNAPWGLVVSRHDGDDSNAPRAEGDDSNAPRAILAASPDNPQCPESCGRSV